MAGDNHGTSEPFSPEPLSISSMLTAYDIRVIPLTPVAFLPLNHLPDGLSVQAAESQLHHQDLPSQHQC